MKSRSRKLTYADEIRSGLFSRKEAGAFIGEGIRHLHSSLLGKRDPNYLITESNLASPTPYPWEKSKVAHAVLIRGSEEKSSAVAKVLEDIHPTKQRELREKAGTVLEEMISNSLYHAYKNPEAVDKYDRRVPVTLLPSEQLLLQYALSPEGLYVSLEDRGGSLTFEAIRASLKRCYGNSQSQIDIKPSGAGLGLYMIFEASSHIRVDRVAGRRTRVSAWIPAQGHFDPDYFSFNYFEMTEETDD